MPFTKTYFLPPTSDFLPAPPTGPLHLGSIISSTELPQSPLNSDSIATVPVDKVQLFTESDWKKTVSKTTTIGLGVYAQFLQVIGFGAEVGGEHSTTESSVLAFRTLITQSFDPDQAYLTEAVKHPAVKFFTKKNFLGIRKPVFLVTGVKTVQGAKVKFTQNASSKFDAKFEVAAGSTPVTVGPKGHWSRVSEDETVFDRDSEFLFAFRVLKLSLHNKADAVKSDAHTAGAFLGKDDQAVPEDVLEMSEVDVNEDLGLLAVDEADGSEVLCVTPSS